MFIIIKGLTGTVTQTNVHRSKGGRKEISSEYILTWKWHTVHVYKHLECDDYKSNAFN